MQNGEGLTAEQIKEFLKGSEGVNFASQSKRDVYEWIQGVLVAQEFTQPRSLLVFFTSLDDALLAGTFQREVGMLARRRLVLVHVMHPPGLAGQLVSNRTRELRTALPNHGVGMSIVDPARIKAQVTSQYLDVKRRQILCATFAGSLACGTAKNWWCPIRRR